MQLNICAPCSLYVNGYWEEKYYLEYYLCLVFSFILQLGATWNLKNGLDLFFCCQWYFLEVCYSFHIIKEVTQLPLVECYNPLSLQLNCNTNKIRLYKIIQNSSQQAIELEISRKSFICEIYFAYDCTFFWILNNLDVTMFLQFFTVLGWQNITKHKKCF